jgi:hypothetical protein
VLLALVFGSIASASQARLDAGPSVWISPASLELLLRPGQTAIQECLVGNETDVDMKMKAYTWDFWVSEKNEKIFGPPGSSPLPSLSNWVTFEPAEFTVKAHETAKVRMYLSVPGSAAGGYFGVAFFEGLAPDVATAPGQPRIAVSMRLGSLLTAAIDGTEHYQVAVESSEITPPTKTTELAFEIKLKNRSNVHLMVQGVLAIFDPAHRLVGKSRLQQQRFLPGQTDTVKAPYSGELKPGKYTAVLTLIYARDQSLVEEKSFTVD